MVVAKAAIGQDGELTVYESGFFLYKANGRVTVGAVERCGSYIYDSGDVLDAAAFENADWTVRLVMEGEEQLAHNNEKRHGSVYSYSNDTVERDDLRDPFDLATAVANRDLLEHVLGCLTEKQRKVVMLRFVDGLTQQEIGDRLGIGQRSVSYLLEAAIKKLKKNFSGHF